MTARPGTLSLGAIADDYTGASDLANTLTKNGLRTVQTIGVPRDDLLLPPVDAIVVALKSRSIAPAEAVAQSLAARDWLAARGVRHILFKICSTFDSTDQGNIGPVMEALQRACGETIVLCTPAFPETGRTVYCGNLFVGDVPLAESPLKDHPLNPMRDSDLRRVLARQTASPVGHIDWRNVASGVAAVRDRLATLAGEGKGSAIADAVSTQDLETLGEAALQSRLSVGASGLGLGLARALAENRDRAGASAFAALGGPAVCLSGSCSAMTLRQIAEAEATMPVLRLDVRDLLQGGGAVAQAIDFAERHLANGPVLIASGQTPEAVGALQREFGPERAGHGVETAMADIAERLMAKGLRRLVVAGGETSGAVVDRLGLSAFELGPEIAPGVPVLKTLDPTKAELRLALKSGNFGGPGFFRDAIAMMP